MIDLDQFIGKFYEYYSAEPRVFSAPGRVNLIGEHTDYNQGFVMPFAIDRQTFVGIAPRSDDLLNLHTLTLGKSAQLHLGKGHLPPKPDWTTYVAGMAEVLREAGLQIGGRGYFDRFRHSFRSGTFVLRAWRPPLEWH